ncbi:MAG: hypothetical protein ACRD3D_01225 [Terriglobia bacterium]
MIRAGYSLRNYTEGGQNFWTYASNFGAFFFQQGGLNFTSSPGLGNVAPGTLFLGDQFPPYFLNPPSYATVNPEAVATFNRGIQGMNPNIQQPYVESWNVGIQRQLGQNNVISVSYVGNAAKHIWMATNLNEINIFENGFLSQFKNAQTNLAINEKAGLGGTFANAGLRGEQPVPLFDAAFGSPNAPDFGFFTTTLQQGQAASLANDIAGNSFYFCNLVGSANFSPCATQGFNNGNGAGYPINFFQVNPYATGTTLEYLDGSGFSNYNALQIDFHQRPTHGMEFDLNYTYARALGIASELNISGFGLQGGGNSSYYTLRNPRLNYGPTQFDIHHVVHVSGTYDLPFGSGRHFFHNSGLANRVIGGWTVGTIITFQSGIPFMLNGGTSTVTGADSGIVLSGITASQLQNSVGVYPTGNPWIDYFNPKLISSSGPASTQYLNYEITPGEWGQHIWLYGPMFFNTDLSISKRIPIHESFALTLQGEFLNAFNHPNWGSGDTGIQDFGFGTTGGPANGPRVIQIRANLNF